jgi:hypothetical protein
MPYKTYVATSYVQRSQQMTTHDHMISLFDDALMNCDTWPPNDFAEKQNFYFELDRPSPQVIKTGWDTTFFISEWKKAVDVDMVPSDELSDKAIVDGGLDFEVTYLDMLIDG